MADTCGCRNSKVSITDLTVYIEIRRARMADKDAVLGIRDNVYDGKDFLPSYYEKIITCIHTKCYLALIQDVAVCFLAEKLVDDGRTNALFSARVSPRVEGTGVLKKLVDHMLSSAEVASHVFLAGDTNPAIHTESFKDANKLLLTRSMSECVFDVDRLCELQTTKSFMSPSQPDNHLLERYMTSSAISQYLFPYNRMIVQWIPYMIMPSNIPLFNIFDSNFVSDVTENADGDVSGLLSISTIYACKCPPFACHIDIYGSKLSSIRGHLLPHLLWIYKNVKGFINLSVSMNQDSDINELNNVLEECGISDKSTVSERQTEYVFERLNYPDKYLMRKLTTLCENK